MQAQHAAQEHGLSRPRAADDADDFALEDRQVDAIVNRLGAEAVDEALYFDKRLTHQPSSVKMIENSASSAITMNIDSTTARVVLRPTASAECCT